MTLQVVQALLPVASLYFLKQMIEAVQHGEAFKVVLPVIVAFGAVQVVSALAAQYTAYISVIHQAKLTDHLSEQVLHQAAHVDYSYYENPDYHDTLHLAQQQSLYKASGLLSSFNAAILNTLSLIFLIAFFFSLNAMFALLFMLVSVPLAAIKWYSGFTLQRLESRFVGREREAGYLHSVLTGINYAKEVRLFGYAEAFIKKFKKIRSSIREEKAKVHGRLACYSLLAELLEVVVMVVIFGMLAKSTWEKAMTIGAFVIYIQGFQRLQSTSRNFLQALVQIFQQRIFLKDLFAFLDIKVSYPEAVTENGFAGPKQDLIVNQLSFKYPGSTKPVLKEISMAFKPGTITAIVGENGSGKSTLVKLLSRIYAVQQGSIQLDGTPLAEIDLDAFRKNASFVFQDFEKYFLTVNENIALGNGAEVVDPLKAARSAKLSGAHPFISKLSKGYDTRLGRSFDKSEQLSGGQWQKLVLSRIFYNDAKLIVLDEPSSALDPVAELELFQNIKELAVDKTIILISHRLYNLKVADYIYVMKNGVVAEEGAFAALIENGPVFKEMYDAQKL